MRSTCIRNAWQCAVSHVFHVSGTNVQFICAVTDNSSLDTAIVNKRIKFVHNLHKFICRHEILSTLYMYAGLKVLCVLKDLRASAN